MLVKHGDIIYRGILFKKYLRKVINHMPSDFCSRCIYYNQYCRIPKTALGGPRRSCRIFDTPEFIYIPREYAS